MALHPPTYHNLTVSDGTNVAYAEAGSPSDTLLLLLHGFPSSSTQFRNLIPLLSPTHHVLAPDLPGFGLTASPSNYTFTFANLAQTISLFLAALNITRYAVYVFDYGAPVAFRLALESPGSITALVSQNGNAYVEGFGHPFWDPIMALWDHNTDANRKALADAVFTLEGTKFQYVTGVPAQDQPRIDPAAYTYDYLQNVKSPEKQQVQLDLL